MKKKNFHEDNTLPADGLLNGEMLHTHHAVCVHVFVFQLFSVYDDPIHMQ